MTQTTANIATINLDALLAAGIIEPALSRKFISKLAWREKETNQYVAYRNGEPSFRLAELENPAQYVNEAENAAKKALLDLNKAYKEKTGRYIVSGLIKDRENLRQILDDVMAM